MRCAASRNQFAYGVLFALMLVVKPAIVAANNACPTILPADAIAISEPRLCRVEAAERAGFSVCIEYSNDRRIYQVVFQGGTSPKAVYEYARTGRQTREIVQEKTRRDIGKRHCNLARPSWVPEAAIYRGTGVCEDKQGLPLPCSLFEHSSARLPEAMRYFVYYEPDGSGVRRVDALSAGRNEHVLEAEFAFQLGQSLVNATCCSDRARAYLAHAAALFPDVGAYRAAMIAHRGDDSKTHHALMDAYSRMLGQSQ